MINLIHLRMLTIIIISFGIVAVVRSETMPSKGFSMFSPYVNGKGEISLPNDFRRKMVHLGSWYVPEGNASGFHDVYADQAAVDEFRKTGKWPDGAAIVKELREAESGNYTTGKNVSHTNGNIKQWFIMIKDVQNRAKNHPNWGDGWGWALIKPNNPLKNVSTDYKKDCIGCHTPVKDKDWIYTEGYGVF